MADDLEARFRELEREVGATPPSSQPEETSLTGTIAQGWQGLTGWINGLNGPAKIVAIGVVGLLAFKLLSFFLNLLSTLVSLGLLVGAAYILYKVFGPKQP